MDEGSGGDSGCWRCSTTTAADKPEHLGGEANVVCGQVLDGGLIEDDLGLVGARVRVGLHAGDVDDE